MVVKSRTAVAGSAPSGSSGGGSGAPHPPVPTVLSGDAYGLQAGVWFGFAVPVVQRTLEAMHGAVLAMITPTGTAGWWPRYVFRYRMPSLKAMTEARAVRDGGGVGGGGRGRGVSASPNSSCSAAAADAAPSAAVSVESAASTSSSASAFGCARVQPYDRNARNVSVHCVSLLAAHDLALLESAELLEVDRMAMGDTLGVVADAISGAAAAGGGSALGNDVGGTGGKQAAAAFGDGDDAGVAAWGDGADTGAAESGGPGGADGLQPLASASLFDGSGGGGVDAASSQASASAPAGDGSSGISSSLAAAASTFSARLLAPEYEPGSHDDSSSVASGGGGGGERIVSESSLTRMYRAMKAVPLSSRLVTRRSPIHGALRVCVRALRVLRACMRACVCASLFSFSVRA